MRSSVATRAIELHIHLLVDRCGRSPVPALGLLLVLVGMAGCRPAVEVSAEAPPLPLLDRDPMETLPDAKEAAHYASEWPAWRGRNSTGIAPRGNPAVHFSDTEGVRWKSPVPGEGYSSPAIWRNRIFLTTASDQVDPPSLSLLAIDRSDGHLVWRKEVGRAKGPTHTKNGYASATVATDGQLLFAFFGSSGLFCYDFDGNQKWHADLGDLSHQWGTAASPMLHGDLVVQVCDAKKEAYLAAFEKQTGRQVWRTDRPGNGCWSTPVLVRAQVDGRTRPELVVNGTAGKNADHRLLIAYDPADGRELWRVRGTSWLVTPTTLVSGGLVISASGRNGPIFAVRPGGSGDVTDTHVVWKLHRGGPYIPSGVAYRNRIFLVGDNRKLACYNLGNGQEIWTKRLRGNFTASLIAADGRVYATNERGTVYVFAAADSFQLLAQNKLGQRCLATPAIDRGELFLRTQTHLYCIPPGGDPNARPTAEDEN